MMLMTLPVLPPYSAENALVSTPISNTASRGMLLKIVWRPQKSLPLLPSTSNHAWRRPAPLVVNRSSFMKTSPWLMAGRLAAFNRGRKVMRWLARRRLFNLGFGEHRAELRLVAAYIAGDAGTVMRV